jgi:very-short-patch-repair endonuclease
MSLNVEPEELEKSKEIFFDLTRYIKYCLGYVRLTTQKALTLQQKYSIQLPKEYFNLSSLLNHNLDNKIGEPIKLEIFTSYDPKKVPKELKDSYENEKLLANKIEELYNKYKNDPYTKQIVLNFGYFYLEVPTEEDEIALNQEDFEEENPEFKANPPQNSIISKFPLFSLLIRIEKEIKNGAGEYSLFPVDSEYRVNVSVFEKVLGENLYYQLVEEFGLMEVDGRFVLPINSLDVFTEIWHRIKAQLKLCNVNFDENSFSLEEINISLTPRVNYFLAEDLEKLAKLEHEQFTNTSLTSWIDNSDINTYDSEISESDLYFPFQYDKYKLRVLSIINNKASVVQGPPGTGKSETIANLLCHLAAKGNKVLFVSQKAQALKVVKDKLKKLNIFYLSGYISNLNSLQLNEEDEVDGIAIQLAALDSYIEKLTFSLANGNSHQNQSLQSIENERKALRNALNLSCQVEQDLFQAVTKRNSLRSYNLGFIETEEFEKSFDADSFNMILQLLKEIDELRTSIAKSSKDSKAYDEKFKQIVGLKGCYAKCITITKLDYQKTGYDRHNQLIRNINNGLRNIALYPELSKLPRDVIDYINFELSKDISRSAGTLLLDSLEKYFFYCRNKETLSDKESELSILLSKCGLSLDQFYTIIKLSQIDTNVDFKIVKEKVLNLYELEKYIKDFRNNSDLNDINNTLNNVSILRAQTIAKYIQNIIDQKFINRWKKDASLRQIAKRLGKAFGKSKRAFKTFDHLRSNPENFKTILDLIPVWIMELDDASRIIPLEQNIFDYVILDEASQCNIAYTLPAMFRSKRTLFFGDSEQMRDSTVLFKSNKAFDELARRYQVPEELRIKTSGSAVQSVLDIASLRGFLSIPLRYHYRSPKELIGFSNKYFYKPKGKELIPLNNNYLTFQDTNRVIVIHQVKVDYSNEISDKISISEAKEILKLFKYFINDQRYKNKSIGILCFFNAQAAYLRQCFEKEGYKEEDWNFKISIIEGIQGDEKDIIIYSFVIRTPEQIRQYYPLTGEGGDIRADINKGRVNVAFSRARQQVHCFISMPISSIPDRIWIKKYLEYAQTHGQVDSCSVDLRPFDSEFEREFYSFIKYYLGPDYLIQNQVPSCGFKIDFVITNLKMEKKLAIECDGPCHFKNEADEEFGYYIDGDEERQRVLESAGWNFYRVKYSDWISGEDIKMRLRKEIINILN